MMEISLPEPLVPVPRSPSLVSHGENDRLIFDNHIHQPIGKSIHRMATNPKVSGESWNCASCPRKASHEKTCFLDTSEERATESSLLGLIPDGGVM